MLKPLTEFAEGVEENTHFWIGKIGRFGYTIKGVLYSIVGLITFQGLYSYSQYKAGSKGAIKAIHDWPFGKFYLVIVIGGLLSYCLWRLVQAITDVEDDGSKLKGLVSRFGYICSGLMYGSLAVWTTLYIFNKVSGIEGSTVSKVLSFPGGKPLIIVAGLINLGVAGQHLLMAITASYMKDYQEDELSKKQEFIWKWIGRLGMLGRTSVFGMIGTFLIIAAWRGDPEKAKGLEAGLKYLANDKLGTVFLLFTACGVIAYGLYCFSRAGYKKFISD